MRDRRSPQEINNQREQKRRNSSEGSFEQTSSSQQQQQQRGSQQPGLGRSQSDLGEQSERSSNIDRQSGSSLEEDI